MGSIPENIARTVEVDVPDPQVTVERVPLAFVARHNPALPREGI